MKYHHHNNAKYHDIATTGQYHSVLVHSFETNTISTLHYKGKVT